MKKTLFVVAIMVTMVGCASTSKYSNEELNDQRKCYNEAINNRNQITVVPKNSTVSKVVKLSSQEDYVAVCMAENVNH